MFTVHVVRSVVIGPVFFVCVCVCGSVALCPGRGVTFCVLLTHIGMFPVRQKSVSLVLCIVYLLPTEECPTVASYSLHRSVTLSALTYLVKLTWSTQPSIPPGSVNE